MDVAHFISPFHQVMKCLCCFHFLVTMSNTAVRIKTCGQKCLCAHMVSFLLRMYLGEELWITC